MAWIEEAYDSEAQKEISSEGTLDRDSQPHTIPTTINSTNININNSISSQTIIEHKEYFLMIVWKH